MTRYATDAELELDALYTVIGERLARGHPVATEDKVAYLFMRLIRAEHYVLDLEKRVESLEKEKRP